MLWPGAIRQRVGGEGDGDDVTSIHVYSPLQAATMAAAMSFGRLGFILPGLTAISAAAIIVATSLSLSSSPGCHRPSCLSSCRFDLFTHLRDRKLLVRGHKWQPLGAEHWS
jgi:hypothetical protein